MSVKWECDVIARRRGQPSQRIYSLQYEIWTFYSITNLTRPWQHFCWDMMISGSQTSKAKPDLIKWLSGFLRWVAGLAGQAGWQPWGDAAVWSELSRLQSPSGTGADKCSRSSPLSGHAANMVNRIYCQGLSRDWNYSQKYLLYMYILDSEHSKRNKINIWRLFSRGKLL